jgi:hypothetical protein
MQPLQPDTSSRVKGKSEVHPRTVNESPEEEWKYNSTLSLTSALDRVGSQHHSRAALRPEKRPVPIV